MRPIRVIQTVDSHTEGNPTRVVVGGVRVPPGRSIEERRDWLIGHDDDLRRFLNFEPRGSGMMCSAIVMPPIGPDADFAVLLLEQDEYVPMCGHCMIGVATTVVETGLVRAVDGANTLRFETPAGLVTCEVSVRDGTAVSVSLENVESFLLFRDASVHTSTFGSVAVDIAFGGDFYAIVDADALGVDLSPANEAGAAAAANEIAAAVNSQLHVEHPENATINRCYETLFTTAQVRTGDLRHVVVSPPGAYDRSPCGTGTSARLADLFSRGDLEIGRDLRFEGLLGTCFTGRVTSSEVRNGTTWVRPVVTGRAYITGFHSFLLDADDPFPAGYRIGHQARPQGV